MSETDSKDESELDAGVDGMTLTANEEGVGAGAGAEVWRNGGTASAAHQNELLLRLRLAEAMLSRPSTSILKYTASSAATSAEWRGWLLEEKERLRR